MITNCNNIFSYLQCVEELLVQEYGRCHKYFHPQTLQKVRKYCLSALILDHSEVIFKELVPAIDDIANSILPTDLDLTHLNFSSDLNSLAPLKSAYQLFTTTQWTLSSQQFLCFLSSEFARFGISLGTILRSRLRVSNHVDHPSRLERTAVKTYVLGVLAILSLLTDVVKRLFEEDTLFVHSSNKAIRSIVNSDVDSISISEIYADFLEGNMQV